MKVESGQDLLATVIVRTKRNCWTHLRLLGGIEVEQHDLNQL